MAKDLAKGFTLIELLVVVIIVGILAGFALPGYYSAYQKTLDREAQGLLELIRKAEKMNRLKTSAYIACTGTLDCNTQLQLDLPAKTWDYSVPAADSISFCAQAARTGSSGWQINETAANASGGLCP